MLQKSKKITTGFIIIIQTSQDLKTYKVYVMQIGNETENCNPGVRSLNNSLEIVIDDDADKVLTEKKLKKTCGARPHIRGNKVKSSDKERSVTISREKMLEIGKYYIMLVEMKVHAINRNNDLRLEVINKFPEVFNKKCKMGV